MQILCQDTVHVLKQDNEAIKLTLHDSLADYPKHNYIVTQRWKKSKAQQKSKEASLLCMYMCIWLLGLEKKKKKKKTWCDVTGGNVLRYYI